MDNTNFESPLKDVLAELQRYFELQLEYNKIILAKKIGELSSLLVLFLLLSGVLGFATLFLSFSFVYWYEENVGSRFVATLMVTAFYLILGISLLLLRKPLLSRPIKRLLGQIVAVEDDDSGQKHNPLQSEEVLRTRLKKCKEDIKAEELVLKEKFEDFHEVFTTTNIVQSIFKSFYETFLTTSNIAKVAFGLVSRIKESIRKKRKKSASKEEKRNLKKKND